MNLSSGKIKKKLKAKSRTELMLFYFDSIMQFTYEEQELLQQATNKALQKLNNWFPNFLKDTEIKFIKVEGSLDWNMPYTINNCIVMPYIMLKNKKEILQNDYVHAQGLWIYTRNDRDMQNFLKKIFIKKLKIM